MDEVFRELNCTKEGLTNEEGQKRLTVFGPNKLEEKSVSNHATNLQSSFVNSYNYYMKFF